jgi:L-asparaginase II
MGITFDKSRTMAEVLAQAMASNPFYVAGEDRFDTALMQVAPGLIAKSGAAGVMGIATRDGELGLAIKIEDGQREVLHLVVIEALSQLHLLSDAQAEALAAWHPRILYNWRQQPVGELCPRFQI